MTVHARQPRSYFTVGLRLLLALSLWQAPVPWVHRHSACSTELAVHLARFHQCECPGAECGWHWHFALPDWGGTVPPDGPNSAPRPPTHAAVSQLSLTSGDVFSQTDDDALTAPQPPPDLLTGPPHASGSGGFLTTYVPAHSPQQLLCRMSC